MFYITLKYFNISNNNPPATWLAYIKKDFLTCYSCLYHSSMITVAKFSRFVRRIWHIYICIFSVWFCRKTILLKPSKQFLNIRFYKVSSFQKIHSKKYRPGALDISFHVIFLRILVSLNVFVISSVTRIWTSVRFPRVPTACRDQRSTKKKDPFSCHKPHPQIFYQRLVYCCRSEKWKNWPKIRVPE